MKTVRRGLLRLGIPALVGAALFSNIGLSTDDKENAAATPKSNSETPWPERRKKIEREWLKLLGDFPKEIPELRTEMKEVEEKDGITRYHVSFQAESDDRVTAWLLVPDAARKKTGASNYLHPQHDVRFR